MKIIPIALLLVINLQGYSASIIPKDTLDIRYSDFYAKVQAFIPNTIDSYTLFFDKPNGEIVDSLNSLYKDDWIIVTIDSVSGSWARLKTVLIRPNRFDTVSSATNTWIPINKLYTELNDPIQTFKVHHKPDANSKTKEFPTVALLNLAEIEGKWLRVKFTIKKKEKTGWIHKYYVCPYPWTICGY